MKLFSTIIKEHKAYEKRREEVIKASRDILKQAKAIIFLCHDKNLAEAGKRLRHLSQIVKQAEAKFHKSITGNKLTFPLYKEGSWNAGVEEYLEAWFFYHTIEKNKIVEPRNIKPSADVYIGALSDCTGEIVRLAVMHGSEKRFKEVDKLRQIIVKIVSFMLPLYLTGQSRQKFDQAKRNLKRIEEILYEVKIRL